MNKLKLTIATILLSLYLALPTSAQEMEHVGSTLFSGPFNKTSISGDYAYCAGGQSLHILSIEDRQNPIFLNGIRMQTETITACEHNGYVYVIAGTIKVYELIQPQTPVLCAEINIDIPTDIYCIGNLAFITSSWSGLYVYDISDPHNPIQIANYYVWNNGYYNVVVNDSCALVDYGTELLIFDISNPHIPELIGSYQAPEFIFEISADGDYAIIAGYTYPSNYGVYIIDISDPSYPVNAGEFDAQMPRHVSIDGNYAYINDAQDNLLKIYDLLQLPNLTQVGSIVLSNSHDINVIGDYAYIAQTGHGAFSILDITDRSNPQYLGSYQAPYRIGDVFTTHDLACVADFGFGLRIVDISNPAEPSLEGCISSSGPCVSVSVGYPYAYLGVATWGFRIVDISDPENPVLIAYEDYPDQEEEVFTSGDYVYIAAREYIHIIDVADPENPILASTYDNVYNCWRIHVEDNYAYVNDGLYPDNSFKIIDVSNPYNPVLASEVDSCAFDIFVQDDYAYVANNDPGLLIYDVSDKTNPILAGWLNFYSDAREISVSGNYALVAAGGVRVIDISDPGHPFMVDNYVTGGINEAIFLDGDYVYVADCYSLEILYFDGLTGVLSEIARTPIEFSLPQNYPNPFNAATTISYSLPRSADIRIEIYDILGRKVETLFSGPQKAGEHRINWRPEGISSGVYYYRVESKDYRQTRNCLLLK